MTMLAHLNRLATTATSGATLVLSLTAVAVAGLALFVVFRGADILTVERDRFARWLRRVRASLLESTPSLKRERP